MPANVGIIPPTLPPHLACYQELINEAIGNAVVQLDTTGFTNILRQTATPTPVQRSYSWHNPTTGLIYHWDAGVSAWVSPHRYTFGTDIRLFWKGSLANLQTFDGGEAGAVGAASGPMWVPDTSMDGRVAIGAGVLPSGATLAIGDTGGEDKHTQTIPELAAHTHDVELDGGGNDGSSKVWTAVTDNSVTLTYTSATTGASTPFNVLNPYWAGTWAMRSGRIYYRA